MLELAFMVFGLGFFLYVIHYIRNDEEHRYQRGIREWREFGRRVTEEDPSIKEPQHKK